MRTYTEKEIHDGQHPNTHGDCDTEEDRNSTESKSTRNDGFWSELGKHPKPRQPGVD